VQVKIVPPVHRDGAQEIHQTRTEEDHGRSHVDSCALRCGPETDENRRHLGFGRRILARCRTVSWRSQVDPRQKRYEVANNSYAKGIVLTLATTSSGPAHVFRCRLTIQP